MIEKIVKLRFASLNLNWKERQIELIKAEIFSREIVFRGLHEVTIA